MKHNLESSFESDCWIIQQQNEEFSKKINYPICFIHSGFVCGWISETFQMKLVTIEVSCKSMGYSCCTFITTLPEKIEEHIKSYLIQVYFLFLFFYNIC